MSNFHLFKEMVNWKSYSEKNKTEYVHKYIEQGSSMCILYMYVQCNQRVQKLRNITCPALKRTDF
jgi:hypothetical protein